MNNRDSTAIDTPAEPALDGYPAKLFIETTTFCNMTCDMCVKQAPESGIADGHLSTALFQTLKPAFSSLDALILNGIGEPLLHPHLEQFIRDARNEMPDSSWIGFQSNGLLLDSERARALNEAGLDRICLSLDSLSPETFRQVRRGGEVDAIRRAFLALRGARRDYPQGRLRWGIQFVVRRDNLHDLPEVLRWARREGADFALVTQLMPYERTQLSQTGYDTGTDAAVEIFERWRREGMRQGIDVTAYPRLAWRSADSESRKVMKLVERMKTEARYRDVFFDIKQLLARDVEFHNQAAAVFAAAAEVARCDGLELRLPALLPRQRRHCAFVEEGGAFISWNGEIHPCYNLWHGYRCYINDWEKPVRPKVFGNLADQGLVEIWNSAEFVDFRRNVLDHEYPFCPSCAVAPCDYVQEENFAQDCFLKSEPCGACLWASGLLQCLQ